MCDTKKGSLLLRTGISKVKGVQSLGQMQTYLIAGKLYMAHKMCWINVRKCNKNGRSARANESAQQSK